MTDEDFSTLEKQHTYKIHKPDTKYSLLKKLVTLLKDNR